MQQPMAGVDIIKLTKRYGDQAAVDGIDLHIPEGSLACLLGPSGCGKTTTLRLVAGFLVPDAGEIRVGDRVVSAAGRTVPPEERQMSMVFQSYALWPHMTIAQNVAYGLKLRKTPKDDMARQVDTILSVTKLSALAGRYPGELSGGQQQRAALARALIVDPAILLLDEPLSNLDANLREEMRFEIRRLHDEFRYTTIYVTHDQIEAMTAADLIVVMNQGRIEQAGSPEDIYERPRSRFVASFIGNTNILEGRGVAPDAVESGGLVLRCGHGEARVGEATAVSIRLHQVRLSADGAGEATNAAEGRVVRQVYLGAHRDYLVALPSGHQVRAMAPVAFERAEGETVWVHLPRESCRALAA
jgi:iron(III) transport system ATP-binding protein